jgi:signal transduction histidine kinase
LPVNPAESAFLCERAYRGAEAKKKVPAGTGIGLYLARRIMELHGGKVEISSENGISTFILRFPPSRAVT